ncbi:MAG: hypothetical protein IJT24_04245 [Lachnospiraceae bacterium]|nr:hypothetical protein [Lachnospiraceae bacterium]
MAITECENGHLYDNALHNSCPYCNGGIYRVDFGSAPEEIGATVLLEEETAGFTDPGEQGSDIGKTVLLEEETTGSPGLMPGGRDQIGETVLLDKEVSFAGRLVCTEGPDEGKTIILEPGKAVDISGGRYMYLS